MANNSKQIKRRIGSAKNISKITKAMQMVAASKMKRAQDQALENRLYTRAIEGAIKKLANFTDTSLHPLLQTHKNGKDALLLISTNKGLCGALNTNLFRELNRFLNEKERPVLIVVGKKAKNFVRRLDVEVYAEFEDIPEKVDSSDTLPISSMIMDKFLSQEFRSLEVLYTDFINTISQKSIINKILPLQAEEPLGDELEIVANLSQKNYKFEPSPQEILNSLLPYYVENTIYQIFLEARASEHSARMVAMKNASENASELVDELALEFNKSRQEAITNELLDITTATLTLS